jgi:isopentenyl phosphate kinase
MMTTDQANREVGALLFLKLGGSLITDKTQSRTAHLEVIQRLAGEIAAGLADNPGLRLVLGHGSGSFGHFPARQYQTRQGVQTPADWRGFSEVYEAAAALNHLVMAALKETGLAAIAFPPSACVVASDGRIETWDIRPLKQALAGGLLPVVYGDVAVDTQKGGTILSTEDLFAHLAPILRPRQILSAGLEAGVWEDYPTCTRLIPRLTPTNLPQVMDALHGSHGTDVTGGMSSKVVQSMALVETLPGLEVQIFSGSTPGNLHAALSGARLGTLVAAA